MRSMLMLGGLEACPQEIFEKWLDALRLAKSEGILELMHINFKSQNICEIKTSAINMIWRTEGEQVITYSHSILIIALTYNSKITAIIQVQFMFTW